MANRFDQIVRNGTLVLPGKVTKGDIGISEGKIVEIADEITASADKVVDAAGCHVLPAAIDGHVHFNEPGRTEWETIKNGSSAVAAGGGATYCDMPLNSSPCTLDKENFEKKRAIAARDSYCDFGLWGGLTPKNLDKIEELAECGVIGFKAFSCFSGIDEFEGVDDYTTLKGMEKLKKLGLPLMVHCENAEITGRLTGKALEENRTGVRDYFAARPPISEVADVVRMIALAEETGCKLIIAHISTAEGVDLVTQARKRGVDVVCETIGHYLTLTDDDIAEMGTIGKCSPPIRSAANQQKMWARLLDGQIAFVSSDHSPCDPGLKDGPFMKVWGGISGCQTTLAGLLTSAYHERKVPLTEIVKLTSSTVNEVLGIGGKGRIETGYDADLAIVSLDEAFTLRSEDLFYLHKVSPYVGMTFRGKVSQTMLRGSTIFQDGKIVGEPTGRLITPARP